MTDPARVKKTDPGNPDVCNIFQLHKAFSPAETVTHVDAQCRSAGWGCIDCKKVLHEHMTAELTPIQSRAREMSATPHRLAEALDAGAAKARVVAAETMAVVRDAMGLMG